MKFTYPACIYPQRGNCYLVVLPDFPLAVHGKSLVEAIEFASGQASDWITENLEDGDRIPSPSDLWALEPESPDGFVSLISVDIPIPHIQNI